MKIMLDECVTKHLKLHLEDHQVFTVKEMGWGGVKNGALMALCIQNEFELLLTIDKNLKYQHDLNQYPLIIVVFNSLNSNVEELVNFIPAFNSQFGNFKKHNAYIIDR